VLYLFSHNDNLMFWNCYLSYSSKNSPVWHWNFVYNWTWTALCHAIHWVLEFSPWGIKLPGHKIDHSASSAKVKNEWSYTSASTLPAWCEQGQFFFPHDRRVLKIHFLNFYAVHSVWNIIWCFLQGSN